MASAPNIISSIGIGSCVVVALYDSEFKIGGIAHIMLPCSVGVTQSHSPYQFADTAVAFLIKNMIEGGAVRQKITAKVVGGSQMFSCNGDTEGSIGARNILSIKNILRKG